MAEQDPVHKQGEHKKYPSLSGSSPVKQTLQISSSEYLNSSSTTKVSSYSKKFLFLFESVSFTTVKLNYTLPNLILCPLLSSKPFG